MRYFFLIAVLTLSCARIIPPLAPKKKGKLCEEPQCLEVDQLFWTTFHNGDYTEVEAVIERMTAVYLDHNRDWRLAAHLGFLHSWALAENDRAAERTARVTDHSTLSAKYFREAVRLNPEKDWRYYGFLVSMQMAEGGIHGDMQDMTRGYFQMKKAVRKYPEFNLFTAAYTLAMSPRRKDRENAVEMLWKNLEKCVGERIDREELDYRKYLDQKEIGGKMSTCWNTWIAPHNMEGFLLILGDLLVKQGELPLALRVYRNAQYFPEYDYWSHRPQLERRLELTELALQRQEKLSDPDFPKFDRCMVCHQEKLLREPPADVHLQLPDMEVSSNLRGE